MMTRRAYVDAFEAAVARHPEGYALPKRRVHGAGHDVHDCTISMLVTGKWGFVGEPGDGWFVLKAGSSEATYRSTAENEYDFDAMVRACVEQMRACKEEIRARAQWERP